MAKILLTLTGQPSNMGASQLFDSQEHFDAFIAEHGVAGGLLSNAVVSGKKLTFDNAEGEGKGSGTIVSKPDDFQN